MRRAALLLPLLAALVAGNAAARDRDPVFESVPEPASVRLYFPPPDSVAGTILSIDDPFEGFNRAMYTFNARFDRAVFLPVVDGYRFLLPDPAETGVRNFFANLLEIRNVANNLLQLQGKDALVSGARLAVNSTLGLAGLFDVATRMGLGVRKEDFGQTLGYWGLPPGPYLVLPFFGPSGVRDAGGLAFDGAVSRAADPLDFGSDLKGNTQRLALTTVQAIDTRANTAFRYYRTGSPFEYVLVRYAYTRMREIEIER